VASGAGIPFRGCPTYFLFKIDRVCLPTEAQTEKPRRATLGGLFLVRFDRLLTGMAVLVLEDLRIGASGNSARHLQSAHFHTALVVATTLHVGQPRSRNTVLIAAIDAFEVIAGAAAGNDFRHRDHRQSRFAKQRFC
jgi:hypothetical protein